MVFRVERFLAFIMLITLIFPAFAINFLSFRPDFSYANIEFPSIIDKTIDNDSISNNEIKSIFLKHLIYKDEDDIVFLIVDINYYKGNLSDYQELLRNNQWTKKGKFISSINDCDDYAFKIYGLFCQEGWSGLPVGVIIWKYPKHADPFFIDDSNTIYIVKGYNRIEPLTEYQKEDYRANIVIF